MRAAGPWPHKGGTCLQLLCISVCRASVNENGSEREGYHLHLSM